MKTSGEFEQELIDTAKEKTGKTIPEWMKLIKASGQEKRNEILDSLKKEYGLNHLQAQLITGIFLNNGQPVYINETSLLDSQFIKCPGMRPLFDAVSAKIFELYPGTELIPKKTYLSFTAKREFAAMNIKPAEIRMGVDLGTEPFSGRLQKSKLTGPMPRISHMIILTDIKQFDKEILAFLQQSYQRTHNK